MLQDLQDKYKGAPPEALDLLKKLLHFNPSKRLTVQEALSHPYLAPVRDENEETVYTGTLRMDIETTPLLNREEVHDRVRLTNESLLDFYCFNFQQLLEEVISYRQKQPCREGWKEHS